MKMSRTINRNEENSYNEIMDKELYDYLLNDDEFFLSEDEQELEIFEDNLYWKSVVEDIDGGDNFIDYCEWFFEMLEEEGYYE